VQTVGTTGALDGLAEGERSQSADRLGPLNELWRLDNAADLECEILGADALPHQARAVLDHKESMTRTLECLHGEPLGVRVLGCRLNGRCYMRKVELSASLSKRVVAWAVIRVDMDVFDAPARLRILEGVTPFGAVLDEAGVPNENYPTAFFSVRLGASLLADIGETRSRGPVYGRRNLITAPEGRLIADVVEILAPISVGH
jgi:hypothetical protein